MGLYWVLAYYHAGCGSWNWYYPYLYAPLASDMIHLSSFTAHFHEGRPFTPLLQLLSVLPPQSGAFLPRSYEEIMASPHSPLLSYYPNNFTVDSNGKKNAWEGVTCIPFLQEDLLLDIVNRIDHRSELTEFERLRNLPGTIHSYSPSPKKKQQQQNKNNLTNNNSKKRSSNSKESDGGWGNALADYMTSNSDSSNTRSSAKHATLPHRKSATKTTTTTSSPLWQRRGNGMHTMSQRCNSGVSMKKTSNIIRQHHHHHPFKTVTSTINRNSKSSSATSTTNNENKLKTAHDKVIFNNRSIGRMPIYSKNRKEENINKEDKVIN